MARSDLSLDPRAALTAAPLVPARVAPQVGADGVSRSFGDRRVLTDVSLAVPPGARVGLIGENGAGKSTLLAILAGADEPDSGVVSRPSRAGYLAQELPSRPGTSVGDVLERALTGVRMLEHELERAGEALATGDPGAPDRYASALAAAERAEVWEADVRRELVLAGLGLASVAPSTLVDAISGGQRSRLALAALLLERPDALLLDEPTNHLDDDAVAFLASRLATWSGPVLFASHDRAFLDEVATSLADLDPVATAHAAEPTTRLTLFGGGYSGYLAHRDAERARWERRYADEQATLKDLRHGVAVTARAIGGGGRGPRDADTMGYDFKGGAVERQVSRRVRDAQRRLATAEAEQVRKPPALLAFAGLPRDAHATAEGADAVLVAAGIRVDGRLDVPRLAVGASERLLVTGVNGAGKSTLLAVLAGALEPDAGTVQRRRGARVALLEQDVRFTEPARTPRELYERAVGRSRAEHLPLTSLGLIAPRDGDRPVGVLSVGQQRRLALALIIARPPHAFLLDEPTNHLSLALATDLEEALGAYPGAVVIASHDRWLRRRWDAGTLAIVDGRVSVPSG